MKPALCLLVLFVACAPDTQPLDAFACGGDVDCPLDRRCTQGYCTLRNDDVGDDGAAQDTGEGDEPDEDVGPDAVADDVMEDSRADAEDVLSDAVEPDPCQGQICGDAPCVAAGGACLTSCAAGWNQSFFTEYMAPPTSDSNAYELPHTDFVSSVTASIDAVLEGDGPLAERHASEVRYVLCAADGVAVWRHSMDARGRPRVALRPTATGVVLEVPHPFFEARTLDLAREVFEQGSATALVVSGTHRCASDTESVCTGVTTACSDDGRGYRLSDPGHTTGSTFHAIHVLLASRFPEAVVVSLHGFVDDGVVLSDGIQVDDGLSAITQGPLLALADALLNEIDEPVLVCRPAAGHQVTDSKCGTANVQGRHVNGSPDACGIRPAEASSRFVHLTLSTTLRRAREPLLRVFGQVFP